MISIHPRVFTITSVLFWLFSGGTISVQHASAQTASDLYIMKVGQDIYVRIKAKEFKPGFDKVWRVHIGGKKLQFGQGAIDFYGERLIPSSTLNSLSGSQFHRSKNILKNGGDESPAILINGMYLGGQHGIGRSDLKPKILRPNLGTILLTAVKHGKNDTDIGSIWADKSGKKWWLAEIPGADSLVFVAANTGTDNYWRIEGSIDGQELFRKTAKSMQEVIRVSNPRPTQLRPFAQNYDIKMYVDGQTIAENNQNYSGNKFTLKESYNIPNVANALSQLPKNGLKPPKFRYSDSTIKAQIKVTTEYTFDASGFVKFVYSTRDLQPYNLEFVGGMQAQKLNVQSGTVSRIYIPGTIPFERNGTRFDFIKGVEVGSIKLRLLSLDPATWVDPEVPPDRFYSIVEKSGKPLFGFKMEYQTRRSSLNAAFSMSNFGKMYPHAFDSGSPPAKPGMRREIRGSFGTFNAENFSISTK